MRNSIPLDIQLDVGEFLAPLRRSPAWQIRLEHFQIGIDNRHIDVAISHQFRTSLLSLSEMIVHEDLAKHGWAKIGQFASGSDIEAFKTSYRSVVQGALEQIHANAATKELLQLLHLVQLKLMLDSPAIAIAKLRNQLQQDAESPNGMQNGRAMEMHERIVGLARLEPGIRYRTLRRLFKIVQRLESKELRKMRKSVVGSSWVVSKQILFNPLLHLPDLTSEEYLMDHYPLLCVDREGDNYFDLTNQIIINTYRNYLPEWAKAPDQNGGNGASPGDEQPFQITRRELHSGFSEFLEGQRLLERSLSAKEFKEIYLSWLDDPRNVDILLRRPTDNKGGWFARTPTKRKKSHWKNPECDTVQQQLQSQLLKHFNRSGITQRAIAAYRTSRLYRQLNGQISNRDIYHYLVEVLPKRVLAKRLASTEDKGIAVIKALDVVQGYIRRMSAVKQQGYAIRYLKDFLVFRRDLKLAYYTYHQMSRLKILQDSESIQLSRDNGSLYEFRLNQDTEAQDNKIKAHVILKADVRGSTEITRQLVEKRLNPATHFSMNFFGPITKLLERFGAKKVFVEGDALILAVLETGGLTTQAMTVANACGLARKILLVMEAQNSQNRTHNLPKLELGLGISFSDGPPAYLYDEQRKIMISPAINEADRLSSCSTELRRDTSWRKTHRHRVEVFLDGQGYKAKAARRLSYNVNGIELAPQAFNKLKSEMVLHKLKAHSRSREGDSYYVGRFVDQQGSAHWLVIREAGIKIRDSGELSGDTPSIDGYFYEVVTDPELIGRVKNRFNSKRPKNHEDLLGPVNTNPIGSAGAVFSSSKAE
jgi:class 3 adenylate cyclase